MITLAQATKETRQILKIAGFLIGTVFIVVMFFKLYDFVRLTYFPPPPPPPEEGFGKLPKIQFPVNENASSLIYQIDTVTGQLPVLPDRISVYKIKRENPYLFNLQDTERKLAKENYKNNETKISDTIYSWYNSDNQKKYITYDIVTKNFKISSVYFDDEIILSGQNLPQDATALSKVTEFLNSIEANTDDIDKEKTKYAYYTIQDNQLSQVDSFSKAQIIKVILYQKNVNDINIDYPKPNESTMIFLLGGGKYNSEILESDYKHLVIDEKTFSSYPLKTANDAFESLKKGEGYIVNENESKNIIITDISFGYYLGSEDQQFAFPVFVFRGKNFIAYIPAVNDKSVSN